MELFTNQILAGIATGAIYACMALAVVMIYQAIDHLNFAQGEMAMFSTFISWQLMQWGLPYWAAFVVTIAFSFLAGIAIERVLFKPLAKAPIRNFTRPTAATRRSVYVSAAYDIPPADVHRVILGAIADVPGVLVAPAPSVVTNNFGEYGIEYWVRYYTDQFQRRDVVDGAVRDRIWYALRRARVEIPYPQRVVHQA